MASQTYKVYSITPAEGYQGVAWVCADTADEANIIIDAENFAGYTHVTEEDALYEIYSSHEGFMRKNIEIK